MSLSDFSKFVPNGNSLFPASDPIGAKAWFNPKNKNIASVEKFSNFSTHLFGSNWFKLFPYQFILIDKSDQAKEPEEYKEAEAPDQFSSGSSSFSGKIITDQSRLIKNDEDSLKASDADLKKRAAYEKSYKRKRKKRLEQEDALAKKVIYTLPIPPDGLSVQPMIASEVMASLGGIVEETSPTAFWMITLTGTTGIAVGRNDTINPAGVFRDSLGTTGLLSGLGSALGKLASTVTTVGNAAESLASDPSPAGLADLANAALLPKLPYSVSGVDQTRNGYMEIHLLHRFLNAYGDMKALKPDAAKLVFCNYKDGQQWQVIVKQFKITKSVNEPMLYRYSIVLQGWDLKDPNEAVGSAVDRFKSDLKSVNTTTLTGLVSSANHIVANTIGNPTNIVPVVI